MAWDPRSYLVEAASRHIISMDTATTATTIVNYYDSITSHLTAVGQHDQIRESLEQQRDVDARIDTTESPSALLRFKGVEMCVPYTVLVGVPSVFNRDKVQAGLRQKIEETFLMAKNIFAFENSELAELNAFCQSAEEAAAGFKPSRHLSTVLTFALDLHARTSGLMDPSVSHHVQRVFKKALNDSTATVWEEFVGPYEEDSSLNGEYQALWGGGADKKGPIGPCAGLMETFEWTRDPESHRVTLVRPKVAEAYLDLSALSKGYIVDMLLVAISEELLKISSSLISLNILVDWGGDIRVEGQHPIHQRPWLVGIERPPKLKHLFDAWKDGGKEPPTQYLHLVELPSGSSVATSGDYKQLLKFGHTHIVDPRTLRPLRVSNDCISSSTVVCTLDNYEARRNASGGAKGSESQQQQQQQLPLLGACMAADALATVLMLARQMVDAMDTLIDVRKNPLLMPCSPADDKDSTSQIKAPAAAVSVERYYLFERNDQVFLHDEDDLSLGEGDAMRREMVDKELQKAATFKDVNTGTALNASNHQVAARPAMAQLEPHEIEALEYERGMANTLKRVLKGTPAMYTVITVPLSAGLCGSPAQERPEARFHAVPMTSAIPLRYDTSATTSVAGHGGHTPSVVMFSVQRTSLLNNFVCSKDQPLTLHWLTEEEGDLVDQLSHNPALWIQNYGANPCVATTNSSSGNAGATEQRAWMSPRCLSKRAVCYEVSSVDVTGDHLMVVANVVNEVQLTGDANMCEAINAVSAPLLRLGEKRFGAPPSPQPLTSSWSVSPLPMLSPSVTCGVFTTMHRYHGKVGWPCLQVKLCSLNPPMLSVVVLCSVATKGLTDGSYPSKQGELFLLNGTTDPFTPSPTAAGSMRGRPAAAALEKDATATRDFQFLPFPAFNEIPNCKASMECTITRTIFPSYYNSKDSHVWEGNNDCVALLVLRVKTPQGLGSPNKAFAAAEASTAMLPKTIRVHTEEGPMLRYAYGVPQEQ